MRDINLLPDSYRVTSHKKNYLYLIAVILVAAVFSAIYLSYLYFSLSGLRAENKNSEAAISKLAGSAEVTREEKRTALVERLVNERPQVSGLLKAVFEMTPKGLDISGVTQLETKEIIISGKGTSNQQITQFTEEIKKVPGLKKLTVKYIQQAGPQEYRFELQGSL